MDRYICALTGASGSVYGLRVASELAASRTREVHLIVSRAAGFRHVPHGGDGDRAVLVPHPRPDSRRRGVS